MTSSHLYVTLKPPGGQQRVPGVNAACAPILEHHFCTSDRTIRSEKSCRCAVDKDLTSRVALHYSLALPDMHVRIHRAADPETHQGYGGSARNPKRFHPL